MGEVHEIVKNRWSTRGFNPDKIVEADKLQSCFEAARWSPSSYNEQPWRFFYANRHDNPEGQNKLFNLLSKWNQSWARLAPVIVLITARTFSELRQGNPVNNWAEYDCGQAAAYFTVQATHLGLFVHQMAGFDRQAAAELVTLPEGFKAVTMFVVGYRAENPALPEDLLALDNPEQRTRKSIEDIVKVLQ
jgi:nitroreductase